MAAYRKLHVNGGQKDFYSIKNHSWAPLSSNPVSENNAHGHIKNHPRGLENTKQCVELLKSISGITSFYPTTLTLKESADSVGMVLNHHTSSQDFKKIVAKKKQDFVNTISYIASQPIDLIYVDTTSESALYFIESRAKEGTVIKNPDGRMLYSKEQIAKDHQELFFKDSVAVWAQQNLTSIWDERERLALCTRPFDFDSVDIALKSPHLLVDSRSLWVNGEKVVTQSLDYLGLCLDHSRLVSWQQIYKKWQQPQLRHLEFVFNYRHIVNAIINNLWLEIDLTFEQEVVIQHCLIYNHGLNLKTWQLEKFPKNTQLLHQLLEPNIHHIDR